VFRQIHEVCALDLKRGGIAPVAAHHHAAHKLLVGRPIIEIAMTT